MPLLNLFGLAEMSGTGGGGVQMRKLVSPLVVHDAAAVPWQESAPWWYQGVVRKSIRFSTGFELRINVGLRFPLPVGHYPRVSFPLRLFITTASFNSTVILCLSDLCFGPSLASKAILIYLVFDLFVS